MEKTLNRNQIVIRTSFIGIIGNIILVAFKMLVGALSGSIAIILDALNNLTDALSSVITMIGTKLSLKKPDKKHPYGHGRIEYVTTFIISFIILMVGGISMYQAIKGIIGDPLGKELSSFDTASIIIISSAIIGKLLLSWIFRRNGKKASSDSLLASSKDAFFDALLSLATLVGIATTLIFKISIENYLGIVIAIFIIKAGIEILIEAISNIIGERPSEEITSALRSLILSREEVKGCYDIILNNYGPNRIIGSAHIEVDASLKANEIHLLTREITEDVYLKMGIILTIGIYASLPETEKGKEIFNTLMHLTRNYPEILQLHAFYINEKKSEIGFDLIIDFAGDSLKIKNEIEDAMKEKYPNYIYKIVIDQDFSD